jgi:hypothetical protein
MDLPLDPIYTGYEEDDENKLPDLVPTLPLPNEYDTGVDSVSTTLPDGTATGIETPKRGVAKWLEQLGNAMTKGWSPEGVINETKPDSNYNPYLEARGKTPIDTPIGGQVDVPGFNSGFTPPTNPDGSPDTRPDYIPGQGMGQVGQDGLSQPQSDFIQTEYQTQGMDEVSMRRIEEAQQAHNIMIQQVSELEGVIGVERAMGLNNAINQFIENTSDSHDAYMNGYKKVITDMDSVMESIEDITNRKIDPDRYISNLDNTQKGMLVLMAFADGFSGKTGSPDSAINFLNSKIQQDIALQERDINARKEGATMKMNYLGQKLSQLGDMNTAKQAMTMTTLEAAKARIQALTEGANARLAPEKAQELIAGIEVKQAEVFANTMASKFVNATALNKPNDAMKNIDWRRSVNLPDGTVGIVSSEEDAKKFNEKAAQVQAFNQLADKTMKMREQLVNDKGEWINPTISSALKQDLNNHTEYLRVALGNLVDVSNSKEGAKILQKLVGKQTGASFAISDIQNAQRIANETVQSMWDTSGIGVIGTQEQVKGYRMQTQQSLTAKDK